MPLYDYQCRDCGQVFEVRATFKQKEQGLHPACPACESAKTQQVVSAPMVVRAGAGDRADLAQFACDPSAGRGCC